MAERKGAWLKPYDVIYGTDHRYGVGGPGSGFGHYAGTLWPDMRLSSKEDAEAAAKIANEAYKEGYLRAQADMRKALGL